MTNLPGSLRQISIVIGVLALSINVTLLVSYLFIGYEAHLHSDSAVRLILAQEILRTGELLPSNWHFVNGDLWLLSAHWFALPIIAFTKVSPFAHALAGLVSASFLAFSFWTFLIALNTSFQSRIWVMAVILGGISGMVAEGLFGQASYSMIFAANLLLLAAVIRVIDYEQTTRHWMILVALVIALQIATNPLRGIVFCVLPLTLALSFIAQKCYSTKQLVSDLSSAETCIFSMRTYSALVGVILVGMLLGAIIRALLAPGLLQAPGVMSDFLQINNQDELATAFSMLCKGVLASLGSRPSQTPALSPEGIYHLLRLLLAVAALCLAVCAVLRGCADNRLGRCFFTVFAASSFLLPAFICVGTNLVSLSPDIEGIRYLLPGIVLLLLLVFSESPDWLKSPIKATLGLFLTLGLVISGYPNLFMVDIASKWRVQETDAYAWQSRELVSVLREQGLEYGYASYWLANSATVQSGDTVKVRPILLEGGLPIPRLWLSSSYWYSPGAWSGETFLALAAEEAPLIDLAKLELEDLIPNRVIRERGFEIWVFPVNLSTKLSWDVQP